MEFFLQMVPMYILKIRIMLKIGDRMPYFEVMDQDGNVFNSGQLLGRKTIIYFYPKDDTSACTAQACNLRDNYARLVAEGYNVIGISKDSVNSHKDFASKHNLPFTLLSDTSTEILQAFGAWGESKIDGKTTMGPIRKTFIFDEDGILVKIIDKVDTQDHASQILE